MKKITFFLFALIAGTTFAQDNSASGTATVNAEIVSPITISENGSALNFGSINGSPDGGTVIVSPKGTRSFVEGSEDLEIATAEAITASAFEINAADGYAYNITIPGISLKGAGADMAVTFDHELGGAVVNEPVGSGSAQDLTVGGTLVVGQSQTAGKYEGTVTVTVSYE